MRSLRPDDVLLVGRLSIRRLSPRGRHYLALDVPCPFCHRAHFHGLAAPPKRSDAVERRVAHCTAGPLVDGHYFVGLDLSHADHNRAIVREFIRDHVAAPSP